ncbi:T6SS effector phospholipase Tle3 domain-containing protein [Limnobaculum parvum]|nr:DUF3274 domain-containing protein [Limnobaculum parvum]
MSDEKATDSTDSSSKRSNSNVHIAYGVHKNSGKNAQTYNIGLPMSMPCIVILVHGVNDVGEAFQHQDRGICAGLNERLGREDLTPHTWENYIAEDIRNAVPSMVADDRHLKNIGKSPIIPFYWGYRPVDKQVFLEDQKRYFDDLMAQQKKQLTEILTKAEEDQYIADYPSLLSPEVDVDLAYDAYVREESLSDAQCNNSYTDQFFNYLDSNKIKNGGLFANATTCIPDMYGPGSNGLAMYVAKWNSRWTSFNDGDFSHPIYDNCHRIYQVFAAQRLADLIIAIREKDTTKHDPINIVGHSQGTIVTMLANFLVEKAGYQPADCVILNHSPYSLESRLMENMMPGNQQTAKGREETLVNFCQLIGKNELKNTYTTDVLSKSAVLGPDHQWDKPEYSRNNFGKVYNYFCPNDQTVSLMPVQGFGWQGIPDEVMTRLGSGFRQRVFYEGHTVGNGESVFSLPYEEVRTTTSYPPSGLAFRQRVSTALQGTSVNFGDRHRTINGEALVTPFPFELMPKSGPLGASDMALTMAAIARDDMKKTELIKKPDYITRTLQDEDYLNKSEIALLNRNLYNGANIICSAQLTLINHLLVYRIKTREEIKLQASNTVTTTSQHSSIVVNEDVSKNAMAYDLAIGVCNAYIIERGTFWLKLLKMADWRDSGNPVKDVRTYYQTGILPDKFKKMMNHPRIGIPEGVVNHFDSNETAQQWPYPWPQLK